MNIWKKKRFWIIISAVFACIFIIAIIAPNIRRHLLVRRIDAIGGFDAINREAEFFFKKFENREKFQVIDLAQTNVIYMVTNGGRLSYWPGPIPHIQIQLGNHFRGGLMLIYDPRKQHNVYPSGIFVSLTNNIHVAFW